jgi:hypothetical protein
MAPPNRRLLLEASATLTGIDFVEVEPTAQAELWVYFIGAPASVFGGLALTSPEAVRIESLSDAATRPVVTVVSSAWAVRNGRDVLHVVTGAPGDFSRYALTLLDSVVPSRIDPFFNAVPFRFQAGCESDLDCKPAPVACPGTTEPDVAVDYTARDFASYRRALLELASLRWPSWTDRLEADVGVMLVEAMSALADEMSYVQDRFLREASLAHATERRSVRQHARLLDYELHDGLAAWTWLRVSVDAGAGTLAVPAGTAVTTRTVTDPSGNHLGPQVTFELGRGLIDTSPSAPVSFSVDEAHNALPAWIWDEDVTCLPAGSTSVSVEGRWLTGASPIWTGADKWISLETQPTDPAISARAQVVKLSFAEEVFDPLLATWTTRLEWAAADATRWPLDLETLTVHANLLPATAGRTVPAPGSGERLFRIRNPANVGDPPGWTFSPPAAIERLGPNRSVSYLLPLLETRSEPLCFVGESPEAARPEVRVEALSSEGDLAPMPWQFQRSFAGSPAATSSDEVFTLDDGTWDEVARYWRGDGATVTHVDYRSGGGFSVRFGDGSLGAIPNADVVFRVTYRVGGGAASNLGAHTLVETPFPGISVTNPLPIDTGVDSQTLDQARRLAPHAWQSTTFRAVRPEDYAEALTRLAWVDRAGARLRWTGSWLSLFATPDPKGAVTLTRTQRREGEAQLDRFRQAGREAHLLAPVYAWLDLAITICVETSSSRSDVERSLLAALFGGKASESGFFAPDKFSFGDGLVRSRLYAALQRVPGVRAVETIMVRRRGHFDWRQFVEEELDVGLNEVLGVANDPLYPERGAVSFVMEGGA